MKKQMKGFGVYLVILLFVMAIFYYVAIYNKDTDDYNYSDFIEDLEDEKVKEVTIYQNKEVPTGKIVVKMEDGEKHTIQVTSAADTEERLIQLEIPYHVKDVEKESIIWEILPYVVMIVIAVIFISLLTSQGGGGGGGKMMNFGKSRARMATDMNKRVKFENVAGLHEEKEELEEIVDFLKNPKKYIEVGARIPKGVILTGPPGTGKTLLAKAIAGEAGVPFFSISGSDFVEMFVGVGASRVRDLFEEAKKNAPCIVFIDEIDAVARRRGTGMGGGHDEREQTLNQLLVEMDGFGVNEGIIVMAATNRVDILDPAILRPGRFDRKVYIGKPDIRGRREILDVHAKNKPLGDDVDLDNVVQMTIGFTGADLENLLNEAAIYAAKQGKKFITQADINRSFVKTSVGTEKKSRVVSDKEKRITAFHESGHAILYHILPDVGPVHTISVIPTGSSAAGYTMPIQDKGEMFSTKGEMLQDIMVSLGGRIAEEMVLDDITTGASQDIKQATAIAKAMVTKFGMSDKLGLICYGDDDDEVFIGRDLAHTRGYADGTASAIDNEVKGIVDGCYLKAKKIIEEHKDVLYKCAELLLEKEKINQQEFEALFTNEADVVSEGENNVEKSNKEDKIILEKIDDVEK